MAVDIPLKRWRPEESTTCPLGAERKEVSVANSVSGQTILQE